MDIRQILADWKYVFGVKRDLKMMARLAASFENLMAVSRKWVKMFQLNFADTCTSTVFLKMTFQVAEGCCI